MRNSETNPAGKRLSIASNTLRPLPAMVPFGFASIAATTFCVYANSEKLWPIALSFLAAAIFAFLLPSPQERRLVWLFPIVLLFGFLRLWSPSEHTIREIAAAGPVEIEGILIEDRLIGSDDLADLNANRNVRLKLERLRSIPGGEWQSAGGTIILRNPDENCAYGRRIRAEGTLTKPPRAHLPGTLDLRAHYLTKGIKRQLWANSLQVMTTEPTGFRRMIATAAAYRENAMERVLKGIEHPGNRQIIAAMTLGFRGSLSATDREIYLRSGMLHLFAISGLHVGILFTIIVFALRIAPCGMRARLIAAPILLLVYVAATGLAPSAVRAWLMLSIWSVGKALPKPVVGLNSILAAATIQLIWNPLLIGGSGFQYSYIVVITLVVGWRRASDIARMAEEHRFWVPARYRNTHPKLRGIVRWGLQIVVISILAWLGGFGLTAWYNGFALPLSWLWNSIAAVVAWLMLTLTVAKAALSLFGIGMVDSISAWPTALTAGILRLVAELASDNSSLTTCGRPPLALILLWYASIGSALLIPLKKFKLVGIAIGATAVAAISIIAWTPTQATATRTITIAAPNSALAPVILAQSPAGNILINSGARTHGGAIAQWLRLQGIDQLDAVILPVDKASWNAGLERIGTITPIANVYAHASKDDRHRILHRSAWYSGAQFHPIDEVLAFARAGNASTTTIGGRPAPTITLPHGFDATLTITSHRSTGWKVELTHPNASTETISAEPNAPASATTIELNPK